MLTTTVTQLLGIKHPVVLGGMASGTNPELVAAVSNAGGLGILGCSRRPPDEIASLADAIRQRTDRPFGLNLLLFGADDAAIDTVLAARPAVFSTAWAFPQQDLKPLFERARASGIKVMHMVSTLAEAQRAADARADIIVAQGTEGGGHVGVISTLVLVPQVARAVAPIPVLAAGGIADGAGLAAALALGAEGALMGTRFLATPEAPVHDGYKHAITGSDGHNTLLTEIPDIISRSVWPGAYGRVIRNQLIETWIGREGELRYQRAHVAQGSQTAREAGDAAMGIVFAGQTAGLIEHVEPAADIVARIVQEAEEILCQRLPSLVTGY